VEKPSILLSNVSGLTLNARQSGKLTVLEQESPAVTREVFPESMSISASLRLGLLYYIC